MTLLTWMASNLLPQRDRAFTDLLAAEQTLRQAAERDLHELISVLAEVAVRLDGSRLEEMRRIDPSVPSRWMAGEWRKFFAGVSFLSPVWAERRERSQEKVLEQKVRAQQDEIERLTSELAIAATTQPPVVEETQAPAKPQPAPRRKKEVAAEPPRMVLAASTAPDGMTPSVAAVLADLRTMLESLPEKCPMAWATRLNGSSGPGSKDDNAAKSWRRKASVVYLIGRWRINSKLEIEHLLALAEGMKNNSGSLHRILDKLIKSRILEGDLQRMSGVFNATLKLFRLTEDGRKFYAALFEREAEESEWERINRLHEGERFPDHTLAILIFTLHARARGWNTQVLPPVADTKAVPDVRVQRGQEDHLVEIELSTKEHDAKWRNLAAINGGRVVLCAGTSEKRARLVGDCKLMKLPGLATDIETMKGQCSYEDIDEASPDMPLWAESWP